MNGYAIEVELVRVIDGDTVVVQAKSALAYRTTLFECPMGSSIKLRLIKPGARAHIRFAGYDAPEKREAGGRAATDALRLAFDENEEPLWLFVAVISLVLVLLIRTPPAKPSPLLKGRPIAIISTVLLALEVLISMLVDMNSVILWRLPR